jgi:hypothetical protein
MEWMAHVAHMRAVRNKYTILSENLKSRGHLRDLETGAIIVLKWVSEN